MKSEIPSVETLNDIQRQWMAVDSNGPKREIDRVCKLMGKLPSIYVSTCELGHSVCIIGGSPTSMPVSLEQALKWCSELGGRTDVVWNGTIGQWEPTENHDKQWGRKYPKAGLQHA